MPVVNFSSSGEVGSITIDNGAYNLIDQAFVSDLAQAAADAGDSDARVVTLRATGSDFCGGGHPDLFANKDKAQIRALIRTINQTYETIERLPVPTIAVVQGRAMGGGFELALRCDFLIAADDAQFRFLEADYGVLPLAGGAQRLAARIGIAAASRSVLLSETIPASDLAKLGVLTVADRNSLGQQADALSVRLGHGPTQAYAGTKRILAAWARGGLDAADEVMIDLASRLFETQDVSIAASGSTDFLGR
ncbi:enoyl-CoA hydratase/isomerase family protein [Sphingomonas sp. UYP23]